MLDALVKSGAIAVPAIAILAIEGVALFFMARSRFRLHALPIAANLLSGLCLILALRASLLGAAADMIALWLGLGFVAHVGDMVMRLRRRSRRRLRNRRRSPACESAASR